MNGSQPGSLPSQTDVSFEAIIQALELVHSPQTSNEERKAASFFLDDVNNKPDAPYHGFALAKDANLAPVVRHYGLTLLNQAVLHRWGQDPVGLSETFRPWIIELAEGISSKDPPYICNKIAQLWAEVAIRCWGLDWLNMDQILVSLWEKSLAQKEFVLTVLESLSEDIFGREYPAAGLRGSELNRACVEIFTPAVVFTEIFPNRSNEVRLRQGSEGWLSRTSSFLNDCQGGDVRSLEPVIKKALATLKTALQWAMHKAVAVTDCVGSIIRTLAYPNTSIQLAAIEALHSLYVQAQFENDMFQFLVCPMYETETISLLRKLYEWSVVDAHDIDEQKYLLSKRLSEMIANLGNYISDCPLALPTTSDLRGFFSLSMTILQSQSLTVSIPVLNTWVRLLASNTIGSSDVISPFVPPLLDLCSSRLFRYEHLPEDSQEPVILFLAEDIESTPEKHAFLGNYRRFCVQIIDIIVQKEPFDAFSYVLGKVDEALRTLYPAQEPFSIEKYNKFSQAVMRVDAHLTVVEAALKGYSHWVLMQGKDPERDEQRRTAMEDNLEMWCQSLLAQKFEDPIIKQRIIKIAVDFCTQALSKKQNFALNVLEYILTTQVETNSSNQVYWEAVKELQVFCTYQLRRLAIRYSDYFVPFYDQLHNKLNEFAKSMAMDPDREAALSAALLIIMQRSTSVDPTVREERLRLFVQPLAGSWQNKCFSEHLQTFDGFCELLRLRHVSKFIQTHQLQSVEDWSSLQLDEEGKALQNEINEAPRQLPMRITKVLLGASTEKVEVPSQAFDIASALWRAEIPVILPNLLKLLQYAHSFYNPSNWKGLSKEMFPIVNRILTDRFWQSGISTESKDDFYAKIGNTKNTIEGFASSVRSCLRNIRENGYGILYCMSRFEDQFFGYPELPSALANALFADAQYLPSHQFLSLLSFARNLVSDCPAKYREHFLVPYLILLFTQLDIKTSAEWDSIEQRKAVKSLDEDLTVEMRDESVLRQLTGSAVSLVAILLEPGSYDAPKSSTARNNGSPSDGPESLRQFIITSPSVLESVVMFCTHALRMRDSRSCGIIARVFRGLIPEFENESAISAQIREFISNDVLKACITSLHESYFVDLQSDLAQLIATTYILYSPKTQTPHQVLLSLPGISGEKVDNTGRRLLETKSARQQRALVLDLLEDIRGVSISEQGKLPQHSVKKIRSEMQERYMKTDPAQSTHEDETDFIGISNLLG